MRSAVANSFQTLLSSVAILGCGVATGIMTARTLEPAGRGLLTVVTFWPQLFIALGGFTIVEALAYLIRTRRESKSQYITSAAIATVISCAITILVGSSIIVLSKVTQAFSSVALWYLMCVAPLTFLSNFLFGLDQIEGNLRKFNVLRTITPVSYLVLLLTLVLSHRVTVNTVVVANVCSAFVGVAVQIIYLRSGAAFSRVAWTSKPFREVCGTSLSMHASSALNTLSQNVDKIVAVPRLSYVQLGYYSVATTLVLSALGLVRSVFDTVLFSRLAQERGEESAEILAKGTRLAIAAFVIGGVVVALCAAVVVPALFGSEYRPASLPAVVVTIGLAASACRGVIIRAARVVGDATASFFSEVVALAGVGLTAYAYSGRTALGIAIAVAISQSAALLVMIVQVAARNHIPVTHVLFATRRELKQVAREAIGLVVIYGRSLRK